MSRLKLDNVAGIICEISWFKKLNAKIVFFIFLLLYLHKYQFLLEYIFSFKFVIHKAF